MWQFCDVYHLLDNTWPSSYDTVLYVLFGMLSFMLQVYHNILYCSAVKLLDSLLLRLLLKEVLLDIWISVLASVAADTG